MAARIKHIALATNDPAKTAEFYKNVFGLTELRRVPADTGAEGVWLSDGYIYFAILKFGSAKVPNMGHGSSSMPGVHHIGFHVDDIAETSTALEENDAKFNPAMETHPQRFKSYMDPDGLMLDLRARGFGWDEVIKKKMQLYQLTPASHADKENVS